MHLPGSVAVALLIAGGAAAAPAPAPGLSSPMVDRAVYRDGAVQRSTRQFGRWTLMCDEIAALRRRYCSLRSVVSGPGGGRPVVADISTGDDGRPAALLHLPVAISLAFGVRTTGRRADRAHGAAPIARSIGIATCDQAECLAVWSLAGSDLAALNAGPGLGLSFCTTSPDRLEFAPDLRTRSCGARADGMLSGLGFKAAVEAANQ